MNLVDLYRYLFPVWAIQDLQTPGLVTPVQQTPALNAWEKPEAPQASVKSDERKTMVESTPVKTGKFVPFFLTIPLDQLQADRLRKLTPAQRKQILGRVELPTADNKVVLLTAAIDAKDLTLQQLSAGNLLIDQKTLLCAQLRQGPLCTAIASCDNGLALRVVEGELPSKLITLSQFTASPGASASVALCNGIDRIVADLAKIEAEVKAAEEAKAKADAERKAKEEAERKAKEEMEAQWFLVMGSSLNSTAMLAVGPFYGDNTQATPSLEPTEITLRGKKLKVNALNQSMVAKNFNDQVILTLVKGLFAIDRTMDGTLYDQLSLVKHDLIPEGVAFITPDFLVKEGVFGYANSSIIASPTISEQLADRLGIQKPNKRYQARFTVVLDFEAPSADAAKLVAQEAMKGPMEELSSVDGDLFWSMIDRLQEAGGEELKKVAALRGYFDGAIVTKPAFCQLDRLVELPQ